MFLPFLITLLMLYMVELNSFILLLPGLVSSSFVIKYSFKYIYIFCCLMYVKASRGAGAQSVAVKSTGCGLDPHSRKRNIYLHLYFQFFALVSRQNATLSSATWYAMSWKFNKLNILIICMYTNRRFKLTYV